MSWSSIPVVSLFALLVAPVGLIGQAGTTPYAQSFAVAQQTALVSFGSNADTMRVARWVRPLTYHFDNRDSSGASGSLAQEPGAVYDSWGARRNIPAAFAQIIGINIFVWGYNEFIRGADFTQISPHTWWENIKHGWEYDDNHFNNNQFAHPFHGSMYYGAARSNGMGYWASFPFAWLGSFEWECCGEQHPPAINDWIATSLGGIAIGEALYKASSTVLDNEATGARRVWLEIAAGLLSPMRGLNRVLSGRAWEVRDNGDDRSPPGGLSTTLLFGSRTVGEGRITDAAETHAFFETDFFYGDVFNRENQGPFESFAIGLQLNFGEEGKGALGRFQVRGNLYGSDMKRSEKTTHVFEIVQHFDYINNRSFEFGGQIFGFGVASRFQTSPKVQITTEAEGNAIVMGAVNSEFAFVAELPDKERDREYDYGPGAGLRVSGTLHVNNRRIATLFYWLQWIHTLNGAEGNHLIQVGGLRAGVPIKGAFGLGADFFVWLRNSYFTTFENVRQRVPQFRLYTRWDVK